MKNHGMRNGSVSTHATVVVWATVAIFSFLFTSSVYPGTCEFRTYTGVTYANDIFVNVGGCVDPNVAKVEDTTDLRRRW